MIHIASLTPVRSSESVNTRMRYGNGIVNPDVLIVHSGESTINQDYLDSAALRIPTIRRSILGILLHDDLVVGLQHRVLSEISGQIHRLQGETVRIVFDLRLIMTWAQLHPCTMAFRILAPYCREGENELELLLRDPLSEDADVIVPRWPRIILDSFRLHKSVCLRNIAIV